MKILKEDIIEMLSGREVKVKTTTFQNDMVTFKNKNDVLTALIDLGYLAYRQDKKTAFIPNEEIRTEFEEALDETRWSELIDFQRESNVLLDATLNKDSKAVAEKIEKIHSQFIPAVKYNDENSLSSVLTLAYLSAMQYYFIPVREMPTGCKTSGGRLLCTDRSETETGFADYVFLPKVDYIDEFPALLVELKWNKSAETAMQQIKDRNYVHAVANYTGNILLVGINYDKENKEHECVIEEFTP